MQNIYPVNGLPFWNETEIMEREHLATMFSLRISEMLRAENAAWHMHRIEAPTLTPVNYINQNYTDKDVYFINTDRGVTYPSGVNPPQHLVMRPETTPGSYAYAQWLLENQKDKPPFVVWQAGKSYRREQDQVTKNMRLKEFWQQEFQCLYTEDTKNDYMAALLPKLEKVFAWLIGRPARVVESDRLPSYSKKTMDIEVELPHKWMEMASISLRTDFPGEFTYTTGKGTQTKKLLVLEVAIGLDRCVYAKFLPSNDNAHDENIV